MACKTLLIGLGSKGSDMVSRAVERIFERHDGLKGAPWVRVLAIDTAPISGEPGHEAWRMADSKNVVSIGLDGKQFSKFVDGTDTLADMDFKKWADTKVFAQAGASIDGAGGVRMIGRGSLLHSASMLKVHSEIKRRLDELQKVDLAAELAARKLPPLPPGASASAIRVYVCGALTGGTSSGSFIDLGYLIQAMGEFNTYQVYGVFALPHPECGKQPAMANAYTALRELNHYLSDGVRYRQRVPIPAHFPKPIAPPVGTVPYRGAMLVMARTGVDADIAPMHESVAEFLYAAACTNIADTTFQKIVDPASQFRNLRIKGVHARFQTFGSATLVFPAAHIERGAACRLAADALEEWLTKPELPVADGLTLLNSKRFTLKEIRKSLTEPSQGRPPLRGEIDKRVDTAVLQAIHNHLDFRQTADAQIEDGFVSGRTTDGSMGARVVPQTIEANTPTVIARWIEVFKKDIDQAVMDLGRLGTTTGSQPDRGPNYAIGYCKSVLKRLAEIRAETSGASAHTSVANAREAMDAKWGDLEKANSLLAQRLGWATGGRAVAAPEWGQAAKEYWRIRVDDECGHAITECLTKWEEFARRTLTRLQGSIDGDGKTGHNPHCILDIAQSVRVAAEAEFARIDGVSPRLNGKAIFVPGQTVLKEHGKAMSEVKETDRDGALVNIDPSRKDEEYARAWLIRAWELLSSTTDGPGAQRTTYWTTTDEPSPLDPPGHTSHEVGGAGAKTQIAQVQLDRLIRPAKDRFYRELFERDVLEEVYGHTQQPNAGATQTADFVIAAAAPFLDIQDGPPLGQPNPQDPRTPSFAFFLHAGGENPPYSDFAASLVAKEVPLNNHIESLDPTRAVVLRTRTTFPAIGIDGIQTYEHHEEVMRKHEGVNRPDGRSPFESRKDVAWKTLDGSPLDPRIEHRMALFLFGLAISAIRQNGPDYEVQTNDPGKRLEADLEKAGLALCRNLTLSSYLEHLLGEWSKPQAAPQLALKVNNFVQHFATQFSNIEFQGRPFSSDEVADGVNVMQDDLETLLLKLLERESPLALSAYDAYVNPHEPQPEKYWREAGTPRCRDGKTLPAGYFCLSDLCEEHLGDPGEEIKLPMKCPQCSATLFKPGWQRRWSKRKSQPIAAGPFSPNVDLPLPDLQDTSGRPAPSPIVDNV